MKRLFLGMVVSLAVVAPAAAVGLGPLVKAGVTDGPAKAFYVTLINPYPRAQAFRAYPVNHDNDSPVERVEIFPSRVSVAAGKHRRLIIIARGLLPGESFSFRVCAELEHQPEGSVHARVCSKLTARRTKPAA